MKVVQGAKAIFLTVCILVLAAYATGVLKTSDVDHSPVLEQPWVSGIPQG